MFQFMKKKRNRICGLATASAVLFTAMLPLLPPISVKAYSQYIGSGTYENLSWSVDDAILQISGEGDMIVPDTDGVVMYPWSDYYYEEVWVDEGITSIGDYAFSGSLTGNTSASPLVYLDLPATITSIGAYAFDNTSVSEIPISDALTTVGEGAFANCLNLQAIDLPESVTVIPDNLFANSGVNTVEMKDTVTSIGENAFSNCTNLKRLGLSPSLTFIGDNAFSGSAIKSLSIPAGITDYTHLFTGCNALETITIAGSMEEIPAHFFENLSNLSYLTVEGTIRKIGDYAFANTRFCDTKIVSQAEEIGDYAFYNTSLWNASLTDSLKSLGVGAFANCESLQMFTTDNSISEIPAGLCEGCLGLTDVVLSENVTSIGDKAFYGTSLATIQFPSQLESIGEMAFSGYIWEDGGVKYDRRTRFA